MKKILETITQKEWQFVLWLIIIMIIITSLPYLVGYLSAWPGYVYNGLHSLSPGDIPVYYSYIYQVSHGQWLAKDLFTSEVQTVGTFNVWWFLVGGLAYLLHLSAPAAFHLSRILTIPILLVVVYLFISYFLAEQRQRKLAMLFLLFASGLGFFFAGPINQLDLTYTQAYWWPIDLWLTEAVTFNVLYQSSHFIVSLVLMLLIFLLILLAFDQNKFRYAFWGGVLALIYFNFHPYYLPSMLATLGVYWLYLSVRSGRILWQKLWYLIPVGIFSLVDAIYHFWLITAQPVIGLRALQNVTVISPIIFVVIGYGALWVGFLAGLVALFKKKQIAKYSFLLIWFLVNIFFIYSPFPFHSRYVQGMHIVLVIFTVVGIFSIVDFYQKRWPSKKFDFWFNNTALAIL
ncbi:MAG: hypothetical protein JW816_04150, partial [Candidatus Buchananbacteria bacterium]|nr:hypothetical protein [Candidatus Buchananbacteria bacterium]